MNDPKRPTPNRLIHETSPYLLQHAHNPVDWQPWDDEALESARAQDRPIFLSIGYSACHWCHVMEHESFENRQIAGLMNEHFVCIKVDREERPDLDQIYMNSVQLMTGHGGWPMSVFLTPDLRPFFGGTYWPPFRHGQMPGFADILTSVNHAWETQRHLVFESAERLTDAVSKLAIPQASSATLNERLLQGALDELKQTADRKWGGFGGAPKFPHSTDLRLLLRCWKRFNDAEALDLVRLSLDRMAEGGIYDHLGGGFHRYSTDARWLVPHFEKMLYDNALLTSAYLEAFQATGDVRYATVVEETLDYVLREMTAAEGGFFSTQDADSEGVEGKFFVWSQAEIEELLDADDADLFCRFYDVTPPGNWEGQTILNRLCQAEETSEAERGSDEIAAKLKRCRETLFAQRRQRVAPGRDEKVLVDWNGLMIAAMSQAAIVLDRPQYADAARAAARFILDKMRDDEGRLWHGYKDGQVKHRAYLDDYACLIDGLVDLYQATFDEWALSAAVELAEVMIARFTRDEGGFYHTADDHEQLIVRNVALHDNATPSGNATAAYALLRLARLCSRSDFESQTLNTLEMLADLMSRVPSACGQALVTLDFLLGACHEVVLVEGAGSAETPQMLQSLYRRFVPNKVVSLKRPDDEESATLSMLQQGKRSADGSTAVYLCQHGACQEPIAGASAWSTAVERL